MQTRLTDYSQQIKRRNSCLYHFLSFGLFGLVLICYGNGVWGHISPLRHAITNHMTWSYGETELIVGSDQMPSRALLSADGRWMVFRLQEEDWYDWVLWDLMSGEYRRIDMPVKNVWWLNATQLMFTASMGPTGYFLFDVSHDTWEPIPEYPLAAYEQPNWQAEVLERWQTADAIYAMHILSAAGYTVITKEQENYRVYYHFSYLPDSEVEHQLLRHVDHTLISPRGRPLSEQINDGIVSPDGYWYAVEDQGPAVSMATMYTQESWLLARAYKGGWNANILGWSHDNSGVYVQFSNAQLVGNSIRYAHPIYKLSPFAPYKSFWYIAHQVLLVCIWGVSMIDLGVQERRQHHGKP